MVKSIIKNGLLTWIYIAVMVMPACRSSKDNMTLRSGKIRFETADQVMVHKLFPFFGVLNEYHAAARMLLTDSKTLNISRAIQLRYQEAVRECAHGVCLANKLAFTQAELTELRAALITMRNPVNIDAGKLNRSPYFINNTNNETLSRLLEESILATNHIMNTYLAGKPPRYPEIDAPAFKPDDADYVALVKELVRNNLKKQDRSALFFELPLRTALSILKLNGRDEAVRYEPLTGQVNTGVSARLKKINWKNFRYSALLVPGLGPGKEGIALDPGGARRCDMAAQRFKKGEAPFIIVSGGHVHPARTPFSEAIEMKKYLIEKHNIPAGAVIAEPHARHTTTNIRNAARLIYTFGMPTDKPLMFVSDPGQSAYLFMLQGRFKAELGYQPYRSLGRSDFGTPIFYADSSCFRRNPFDPLDP